MDERQQQTIAEFFKDYNSYTAANIGMWIGAGLAEFFLGIFMCFPYQDIKMDAFADLMIFFSFWGAWLYIMPYIAYYTEGKKHRIYDKLKYFPVSLRQLRLFRMKKLIRFCLIVFGFFLVGQLFFAFISYGRIELCNLLYPLIGGFIIPFGVSAVVCIIEK